MPLSKKMKIKLQKLKHNKAIDKPGFARAWSVTSTTYFAYLAAIDITTDLQTDSSLALRIIPLTSHPEFLQQVVGIAKEYVTPDNSTYLVCNFDDLPTATRLDLLGMHATPWGRLNSSNK